MHSCFLWRAVLLATERTNNWMTALRIMEISSLVCVSSFWRFGTGNWKVILNSYRDVFEERTEVRKFCGYSSVYICFYILFMHVKHQSFFCLGWSEGQVEKYDTILTAKILSAVSIALEVCPCPFMLSFSSFTGFHLTEVLKTNRIGWKCYLFASIFSDASVSTICISCSIDLVDVPRS